MGSSTATSLKKSHPPASDTESKMAAVRDRSSPPARPGPSGCQGGVQQPTQPQVARIVGHVEQDAGRRNRRGGLR